MILCTPFVDEYRVLLELIRLYLEGTSTPLFNPYLCDKRPNDGNRKSKQVDEQVF